jgi:hypothetical protein
MLLKRTFLIDEPKISNISLETGSNVTEQTARKMRLADQVLLTIFSRKDRN